MSKPDRLAWFPFYGRDFFMDEAVQTFTLRQIGIYLTLLWHQWEHGSIPPEHECLTFPSFARDQHDDFIFDYGPNMAARRTTQAELKQVLNRCFPPHPSITHRLANPRLLQVRLEQDAKTEVYQQRARKGGLAKSTRQAFLKSASSVLEPCYSESEVLSSSSSSKTRQKIQSPSFDLFWTAYPRKVGKADALKAWKKLTPDDTLLTTILSAIEKAKGSPDWLKDSGQYIPHPATWLNGKRWEDEQTRPTPQPKPPIAPKRPSAQDRINADIAAHAKAMADPATRAALLAAMGLPSDTPDLKGPPDIT